MSHCCWPATRADLRRELTPRAAATVSSAISQIVAVSAPSSFTAAWPVVLWVGVILLVHYYWHFLLVRPELHYLSFVACYHRYLPPPLHSSLNIGCCLHHNFAIRLGGCVMCQGVVLECYDPSHHDVLCLVCSVYILHDVCHIYIYGLILPLFSFIII